MMIHPDHITFRYDAPWEQVERDYLKFVLDRCGGNRLEAARKTGINVRTIHRKLKKWQIPHYARALVVLLALVSPAAAITVNATPSVFGTPAIAGNVATFSGASLGGFGLVGNEATGNTKSATLTATVSPAGWWGVRIKGGNFNHYPAAGKPNTDQLTVDAVPSLQVLSDGRWVNQLVAYTADGTLDLSVFISVPIQLSTNGVHYLTLTHFSSQPLAGDLNWDGLNDSQDYVFARRHQAIGLPDWRANYGNTNAVGAGVPEPIVVWPAAAVLLLHRRRV